MMNTKKILSTLAAALLLALPHQASAAIDPASVQKLVADGPFGWSVSLSADGGTALIEAADREDDPENLVYVFVKGTDGRWNQQGKLIVKDEITAGRKPGSITSVTLSADGRTAFIGHHYLLSGGLLATYESGSVHVFVKGADGRWSQHAKLTGENSKEEGDFGSSDVSLSADGSTALIGSSIWGPSFSYFFVRGADGRWNKQAKIPGVFGDVSLSANGSTALIGTGVFVKGADGKWSKQALIAADGNGSTVSLSGDGGTALIGAPLDDSNGRESGSASIFVKGMDGIWSQKAKLTAADGVAGDHFGSDVSLSADGRIALIDGIEAAYVFAKSADGSWKQQAKLTVGGTVSLSADGGTVLVGQGGAAYVYGSTAAPQPASKPAAVKP